MSRRVARAVLFLLLCAGVIAMGNTTVHPRQPLPSCSKSCNLLLAVLELGAVMATAGLLLGWILWVATKRDEADEEDPQS